MAPAPHRPVLQLRLAASASDFTVNKVNGFKLYGLGGALFRISLLRGKSSTQSGTSWEQSHSILLIAQGALDEFLKENRFALQTSMGPGMALLETIRSHRERIQDFSLRKNELDSISCAEIQRSHTTFINVIQYELPELPLYLVGKKGGHDTRALIEQGEAFFPDDLLKKVPTAIPDVQQGARCIAFELPTASGYHFHRANESVLRVYFDAVTNGATRPNNRSIGKYLQTMDNLNAGSASVKASLRDLASHHRNPLIHPEHSLKDVNEAIALMNAVHAVVVPMLAAIP